MVKTMKITAALLAFAAFAALLVAVYAGRRPDPQREPLISSDSVTAGFEKAPAAPEAQSSPLIVQAQLFQRRIDPPPPPAPAEPARPRDQARAEEAPRPAAPPPPPARFEVVATSYNPENPQKSYALVKQTGQTNRWVTVGDRISHSTVTEILDGKVVTSDGREYSPPAVKRVNLLAPGSAPPPGYSGYAEAPRAAAPGPSGPAPGPPPAEVDPEATRESIEWLRQIMTDPESMGISGEDAAQLGDIGRMLSELERDAGVAGEEGYDPDDEVHQPPRPFDPNEAQ